MRSLRVVAPTAAAGGTAPQYSPPSVFQPTTPSGVAVGAVRLATLRVLRNLGALQPLPRLGVRRHDDDDDDDDDEMPLVLSRRSDLVDGTLFARVVLAAQTCMGFPLSKDVSLALHQRAESPDGSPRSSRPPSGRPPSASTPLSRVAASNSTARTSRAGAWAALVPLLDEHFDVYIPEDQLLMLEGGGSVNPRTGCASPSRVTRAEAVARQVLDDVCENAVHVMGGMRLPAGYQHPWHVRRASATSSRRHPSASTVPSMSPPMSPARAAGASATHDGDASTRAPSAATTVSDNGSMVTVRSAATVSATTAQHNRVLAGRPGQRGASLVGSLRSVSASYKQLYRQWHSGQPSSEDSGGGGSGGEGAVAGAGGADETGAGGKADRVSNDEDSVGKFAENGDPQVRHGGVRLASSAPQGHGVLSPPTLVEGNDDGGVGDNHDDNDDDDDDDDDDDRSAAEHSHASAVSSPKPADMNSFTHGSRDSLTPPIVEERRSARSSGLPPRCVSLTVPLFCATFVGHLTPP